VADQIVRRLRSTWTRSLGWALTAGMAHASGHRLGPEIQVSTSVERVVFVMPTTMRGIGRRHHWAKPLFDAVLHRVADQLLLPVQVELLQDVADVVLDRFRRDEQPLTDVLVRVTPGDVLQYFAFSFRKRVGTGGVLRHAAEFAEHQRREVR